MELSAVAQGLNSVFYSMDYAILEFYHGLAESAGGFLTPFFSVFTLTAWKGAFLILLSLLMIFFPKTRRAGLCALIAMAVGALFTNLIIKQLVARPRPYDFDATLRTWWEYVGAHMESDKSFPSGHMTASCAFCTGFILIRGKKWLPAGIVFVVLMGISRNYLIVHYPSDVLFGFIFGTAAGIAAFFILRAVYRRWGQTRFLKDT